METIISNIIAIPIDDGVSFCIKRISEIMEEADYPGVRVSMENISKNYSYAVDVSWHIIMEFIRELYQTVFSDKFKCKG